MVRFKEKVQYVCKNKKEMDEISRILTLLGFIDNRTDKKYYTFKEIITKTKGDNEFTDLAVKSICLEATNAYDFFAKSLYEEDFIRLADYLKNFPIDIKFTKSYLKSGMVVELRDGTRCILVECNYKLFLLYKGCFIGSLNNYDEELCHKTTKNDIMKVFNFTGFPSMSVDMYVSDTFLNLLWENPVKEMTISDIEKELGYKIKVVQ